MVQHFAINAIPRLQVHTIAPPHIYSRKKTRKHKNIRKPQTIGIYQKSIPEEIRQLTQIYLVAEIVVV